MTAENYRALGPWCSWALVIGGTFGPAVFMIPVLLVPLGGPDSLYAKIGATMFG